MYINKRLIEEYIMKCKDKRLSEHTIKAYRIDLKQMYNFMDNKQINKENLQLYLHELNKKYKPRTIKRKLASVHAFFEELVFEEVIEYNPLNKIRYKIQKEKTLPKTIRREVLQEIFKRVEKSDEIFIKRDKAILKLLISSGIRISELCNIKIEDVYFYQRFIKIHGKGRKERIIYLEESVYICMKEYYDCFSLYIYKEKYFFINSRFKKISDQSIRKIINKYTKLLNTNEKITPHMFRHTFATFLLEQDVDISYIQKILGHSSIYTTTIYAYASSTKQKEILMNKNPINMI